MKKKVISGLLAAALMFCGFMGVRNFMPEERSITINNEPVSLMEVELTGQVEAEAEAPGDGALAEGGGAPADDGTEAPAAFKVAAKSAILMDADSGTVLWAQDDEVRLPPASVTKVMTMLLILEAVEEGRISLADAVVVSEAASAMGGSQMYLESGEEHTVEELLMGIAMVSANDACVAVAEHLCGTAEVFIEAMNARAKELGMENTNFVNTNGLPAENHYSSAHDIAVMTSELLSHKASHQWLTKRQAVVEIGLPGKEKDFELINSNKLLYQYDGALGVKTGFTQEAMFCLSGAAERDGLRLVAVVLGAESSAVRFSETKRLLDYGFVNYENHIVAEKGERLKKHQVKGATPEQLTAVPKGDCRVLIKKGCEDTIRTRVKMEPGLKAPIKKGTQVGELVVFRQGAEAASFPLVAEKPLRKATLWERLSRWLDGLIPG